MTPENFCYWLQGFAELSPNKSLGEKEWQVVQDHLKLVFDKQSPNRNTPTTLPKENTFTNDAKDWNIPSESIFNKPWPTTKPYFGPNQGLVC